jgi:hypothetical protein
LLRAYQLVGFTPERDFQYVEINRALRAMHPVVVANAIDAIRGIGGTVQRDPVTDVLSINDEFTASLIIVRCCQTAAGALRWNIRFDLGLKPDITIAIRMNRMNLEPLDYYLLPRLDMAIQRIRLAENNGITFDTYRFDTLDPLFRLAERVKLLEAA